MQRVVADNRGTAVVALEAAASLIKRGMMALIGPRTGEQAWAVSSLADDLGIAL